MRTRSGITRLQYCFKVKKVIADEIDGEIKELRSELRSMEENVEAMMEEESNKQVELDDLQMKYEEVSELVSQKENIQKEVDTLVSQVEEKNGELNKISGEIANKKSELDKLNKGILAKRRNPELWLPASF